MDALKSYANTIAMDPQLKPFLVLLKAARNGAVYGMKIRFPHALVMVFLFRSGTVQSKISRVLGATATHARSLATFAFVYKSVMLLLRKASEATDSAAKEPSHHALIAGLIGGYTVFGREIDSPINQQIVIYIFARIVLGFAKLWAQKNTVTTKKTGEVLSNNAWPAFATVSWGLVMWLFRWHPDVLQSSLRSSMVYIYTNSERWDSLENLLLHNK